MTVLTSRRAPGGGGEGGGREGEWLSQLRDQSLEETKSRIHREHAVTERPEAGVADERLMEEAPAKARMMVGLV